MASLRQTQAPGIQESSAKNPEDGSLRKHCEIRSVTPSANGGLYPDRETILTITVMIINDCTA
jgi:hypothetical protein